MATAMLAVLTIMVACILLIFPAIALYNESEQRVPRIGRVVLFLNLIILGGVIAVIPIHIVADLHDRQLAFGLGWAIGVPLGLSAFFSLCVLVMAAVNLAV